MSIAAAALSPNFWQLEQAACGKRISFSPLFLCLSRACLGKMIVFTYRNCSQKRRFSHRLGRVGAVAFLLVVEEMRLDCVAGDRPRGVDRLDCLLELYDDTVCTSTHPPQQQQQQ
jgi:hypothetical protein